MDKFLYWLNQLLATVCPESYLETNPQTTIVYPYLVYEFDASDLENRTSILINVYLVDDCAFNTLQLEQLVDALRLAVDRQTFVYDEFVLQTEFRSAKTIPSGVPGLKKRWAQILCKVDWRK